MASLSGSRVEDNGLTEERPIRLLDALEGRTDTLLGLWRREHESRLALQRRLAELEAAQQVLADKHRELEANRLELVEETRELDEQNRELEEHNRHLHERLTKGQGENTFPRPARRSQGLSALIGRQAPPGPVGARFIGRKAEPESPESLETSPSPDSPAASPVESPRIEQSDETPSPQVLLAEWYQRYPGAFFKGHTRPLKVGIHEELAEREPWPEKLVRRALACYVNLPRYLKAVREGAERIGLEGQPAGNVDPQAAEHARKKLDRLQAERRGKAQPGQPSRAKAGPRRIKPEAKPAVQPEPDHPEPTPAGRVGSPSPEPATPRSTAEARPVTMEEKLAALVAKHRQP